jgi:hypothetical protein
MDSQIQLLIDQGIIKECFLLGNIEPKYTVIVVQRGYIEIVKEYLRHNMPWVSYALCLFREELL